jgi:hypothetical protein
MTIAPAASTSALNEHASGGTALSRLSLLNGALESAWSKGWCSRPSLDPDLLLAKARAKTGLEDMGVDAGWRARLDLLSDSLQGEASLTPLGLTIAHGQLVAALCNRLRAHAMWRRHPEIQSQPIAAPIIVLGQMRSGTTRMQRLLACDPRFTFTRFFESWNPMPVRRVPVLPDDRRLRGWLALQCASLLSPDFKVIHPTGVAAPDEEIGLHNVSIFGSAFEAQWRVPSFARHGEASDARPVYAEFKRLLQTIAWFRGAGGSKPWILKIPQLTQDLDAVLATFPDARLICLHRSPAALAASSASLAASQMRIQSDGVDPHWIGREWLRKIALRQRRSREVRARSSVPQIDVAFDDMNADWRHEMHRVYAMLGVPLTQQVEARMARYAARRSHRRLACHRYDLADYGLSVAEVEGVLGSA